MQVANQDTSAVFLSDCCIALPSAQQGKSNSNMQQVFQQAL